MTERTLLLRFAGPAQSWASSPFAIKATEGVPTRSGVLGLLAAALGLPRGPRPSWLEDTMITVRVDRPGTVMVDFQTINPPTADQAVIRTRQRTIDSLGEDKSRADFTVPNGAGNAWKAGNGTPSIMVTERAYLADAEFIVAISHPDAERLDEIAKAVRNPVFVTYLGRKAFAPAFPFYLGVRNGAAHDLLGSLPTSAKSGRLAVHQITQDRNYANGYVTPDVAQSVEQLWKAWKTE